MIIPIDNFRPTEQDCIDHSLDCRRLRGNALAARKFKYRGAASPLLPDDFNDFDAKDFIERAYALATQI